MTRALSADICVIGGGSAGLSVAAGAAMLGVKTVLVEKGEMGGDCLNFGCVPSKALIAAGKHAHAQADGAAFGIRPMTATVDFAAVNRHVHGVIETIAPIDSQERFEGLGVTVLRSPARFVGPRDVEVGDVRIRARRFVIATGSRPMVPPIPGLDRVPYLTNETIFGLTARPGHLLIIGGGPIGLEMAQAHRRLGSSVSVIEAARALGKDDPELAKIVLARLREEGVALHEGAKVSAVAPGPQGVAVSVERDGKTEVIEGTHLLVAVGRAPTVEGLNLEAAGVTYSRRGIAVDAGLRTSNRRIYAIGDVCGGLQFTHVAGYHASLVVRNALFRLPARADHRSVPWVTYTDPELAHVGLAEEAARAAHGAGIRVIRFKLHENDRAQAERRTEGLLKVVALPSGRVLGATLVAPHAGDLIQPWVLAVAGKIKLADLASMVVAYPTLGEVNKRAASEFYRGAIFGPGARRLVGLLKRLG